ncbi:MAG: TIGR02453 family protein, partial [Bacteroidota bacterium]
MSKAPTFDIDVYPPFEGFPKEGIAFFKKLKRNNSREWFEKHKGEYEEQVKLPMQCLVAALRPHFARFAPEYELNPKRAIFRIYRDVRFSKDKTPYKTHVAAHFVLRGKP